MRNRLVGSINVSSVVKPVKAAFLYWAVITTGAAPAVTKSVSIERRFPTPTSAMVNLAGTVVGTGATPCWPGNTITVLKASVPTSVTTAAGTYEIKFAKGASGSSGGEDPWFADPKLPLLEGASLVIVSAGGATVAIYDKGLAGATFYYNFDYMLTLPAAYAGSTLNFDNIGADGQHGVRRGAGDGAADEVTTVNGTAIAGTGSVYRDSDWNGNVAVPLPELWDHTGHDIRPAVSIGSTALTVNVAAAGDCLTPVANFVKVK